jgi:hypothetical protein
LASPANQMTATPEAFRYDAFLSYRREEPDLSFAWSLLQRLESQGFGIAIDRRDFRPEQTFLGEMERCIKESRFTLAVLSPRYLQSGNTAEEVGISKVLDLGERRRRLVPLLLEAVELPVWIYGIVGIDFTGTPSPVDPFERLCAMLRSPVEAKAASGLATAALHLPTPFPAEAAADRRPRNEEGLGTSGGAAAVLLTRLEQLRPDVKRVFTPKVPVIDQRFLFGRDLLLKQIAREMEMHGSTIVLYGPPNAGKTSLLRFLRKQSPAAYCLVGRDYAWPLIVRLIFDRLNVPAGAGRSPLEEISRDEAAERLARVDGLVIIDAFENVKSEERRKFTDLIKALSDRQALLSVIIAGVAERAMDLIDNFPSVQRHITAIAVPPLGVSDLEKIIDQGFGSLGLDVDPGARALILARSAGLASEIHRYCLDCFHALGERIGSKYRLKLLIGTHEFELAETYHPTVG